MDIMSLIALFGVSLPLLNALYLLIARATYSVVKKSVLNNTLLAITLLSFFIFCACSNLNNSYNFEYSFLHLDKFSFNFGLDFNPLCFEMLAYSAITYFLIALSIKLYFSKRKQFYFTKQRFYAFLSFLIFNTYLFLISPTLFQMLFFWILQGVIIFVFSYFDIFKKVTASNILRFHRITLIGDFAFILLCLILLKYAILSQGYVSDNMLNLEELNVLLSYSFGICSHLDLVLLYLAILTIVFSKLFIFPFSCYYSFFANSSDVMYLSVYTASNSVLAFYFLLKMMGYLELFNTLDYLGIYLAISAFLSLIFILHEKNIKIIFGYIISIVNCLLIYFAFNLDLNLAIFLFCIINLLLLAGFCACALLNKTSFKKALIQKRTGFILEYIHIFFFEKLPEKIYSVIDFIDSKITQNILNSIFKLFSFLAFKFTNNTIENSAVKNSINILIIFAAISLLAVLLTLFRGF